MFKEVSVLYHITIETPNRNEKEKKRWVFLRRVTRKHCEIMIEKEDKIARVLFTKERWIGGVTPKVQHFYHTFIDKSLFVYIYWHSRNVKSPFYGLKNPVYIRRSEGFVIEPAVHCQPWSPLLLVRGANGIIMKMHPWSVCFLVFQIKKQNRNARDVFSCPLSARWERRCVK